MEELNLAQTTALLCDKDSEKTTVTEQIQHLEVWTFLFIIFLIIEIAGFNYSRCNWQVSYHSFSN
jgi:hypothetical protein